MISSTQKKTNQKLYIFFSQSLSNAEIQYISIFLKGDIINENT